MSTTRTFPALALTIAPALPARADVPWNFTDDTRYMALASSRFIPLMRDTVGWRMPLKMLILHNELGGRPCRRAARSGPTAWAK